MNGFDKRRNNKMNDIKKSALDLFIKQGVKKTTTDQIAKHANVSKVTLFKYFESKQLLTNEVLQEQVMNIPIQLSNILNSNEEFTKKLINIYNNIILDYLKASKEFNSDILMLFYEEKNEFSTQYFESCYKSIYKILEEGRDAGYIRDDINNEAILMYTKIVYNAFLNEDSSLVLQHSNEIKKMFYYGIVKDNMLEELLSKINDISEV